MLSILCIALADSDLAKGILGNLSTVALTLAGIWGAIVAHRGLTTWREQIHGKATFEGAREFLRLSLKLQHEFSAARSAWIDAGETAAAAEKEGMGPVPASPGSPDYDKFMNEAMLAAYRARYDRLATSFNELYAASLEAEILFGATIRDHVKTLKFLVFKYEHAIRRQAAQLATSTPNQAGHEPDPALTSHGDGDEFDKAVAKQVTSIRNLLMPHVRVGLHMDCTTGAES